MLYLTGTSIPEAFRWLSITRSQSIGKTWWKLLLNCREMLKAQLRLELLDDKSVSWPAWEIMFDAVTKAPRGYFNQPEITIAENGPARISLCVVRTKDGSEMTQYISLAAGSAGDRLEFRNDLKWNTQATLLKAA
ncbi:MAG: glycoside hydrolase family 38 C-terminal domain-containing protein, partial [Bacteroidales bacterium]